MIIYDNHFHLSARGEGLRAVEKFAKTGGTHLNVIHSPSKDFSVSRQRAHAAGFEATVRWAQRVNEETEAKAWATVGPYPVELVHLSRAMPLDEAVAVMKAGMDLAGRMVEEGKAVAIGEIGRPHFPVDKEVWDASNEILSYGMTVAVDADCPVILHTEAPTSETCLEFAAMADAAGLPRERVIKHYCPPLVLEEENHGIFPSVIARKDNILEAARKGTRFMMETDYLDDPGRPGAVLGPATVPRRTQALLDGGVLNEDELAGIHREWPERLYGVAMD